MTLNTTLKKIILLVSLWSTLAPPSLGFICLAFKSPTNIGGSTQLDRSKWSPNYEGSIQSRRTLHFDCPYVSKSKTRLYLDGKGMAGNNNNPLKNKHLLGDVLRALQPRYLNQVKETIVRNVVEGETKLTSIEVFSEFCEADKSLPRWEDLSKRLKQQQTSEEQNFRSRLLHGIEDSSFASFRKFSDSEKSSSEKGGNDVAITLYRDSASWCPYCQKVWMALTEKKIDFKVIKVDMNCYAGSSKPEAFLKIQENGSLPCAVIHNMKGAVESDNYVVSESDEILKLLDSLSENRENKKIPTLLPSEHEEYMKYLCDDGRNSLERRLYTEWMWYLTGVRKPLEYKKRYEAVLGEVETALASSSSEEEPYFKRNTGPYFLGQSISMADIKFIPFLERQAASLFYYKGYTVRDETKFPNLCRWFAAMESRPSYKATKSDYYTHSRSLPPQLGGNGCSFGEDHEVFKASVDAYCLPSSSTSYDNEEENFTREMQWYEPGWDSYYFNDDSTITKNDMARREAAERIIQNHEKVCKFAARGAGRSGFPPASAELSDPKATSNEIAQEIVDVFLRYTIVLLLVNDNSDEKNQIMKSLDLAANSLLVAVSGGENDDTVVVTTNLQATIDCLDYLRMRIGVPRDMSYPAAHVLRETLLNVSKILLSLKTKSTEQGIFLSKTKEKKINTKR